MVYTDGARLIGAEELKETLEEEYHNPTVERLMFIEAKAMNGEVKVFPCFVAGYSEEKASKVENKQPELAFYVYIVQAMGNGEFGLVQVRIMESEIGVSKRLWDKPPTKAMREIMAWVDPGKGVS